MNRPLVYFSFSLFLGCLSSIIFMNDSLSGAAVILAASFLVIMFFTVNKKFFFIILFFYLIGISSFALYYQADYNVKCIKVRITENKKSYYIASLNGKEVLLYGDVKNIEEGRNVICYGKFSPQKDYSKGIIGEFNASKIKVTNNDYLFYVYDIKRKLYENFFNYLGTDKSAVVMSLCFGDTKNLSILQKNQFQQLGVLHAISVSGFHIALIFQIIESSLGVSAAIIISFIYLIFTGLQAATIRSFIMIIVFKLSKKFYKKYDSLSSLSLSSMIILCYKPFYAVNIGFILTVLATLGIILFYKKIQKILYFFPKKINEALSLTFSAQVFSMPYVAIALGNISWGFIVSNVFLAPIYSLIVVIGNLALLVMKVTPLFKFINFLLYNILTALDGANFLLLKISPPVAEASFLDGIILLIIFLSYVFVKHGHKKFLYLPALSIILLFSQHYYLFPEIEFLNSGSGDNILVKYHAETILLSNSSNNDENKLDYYKKYSADKIITNFWNGCTIKFNKDFIISVPPNYGKQYKTLDLNIHLKNEKIIFTRNAEAIEDFKNKYVIIEVPKKKYFGNNTSLVLSDKDFVKYEIIFKNVYLIN